MKTNIAYLLFLAICSFALVPVQAETKIGTVDMLKLVRNHSSYEPNKALLTETQKDYEKRVEKIKESLEELQEEGRKKYEQSRQPMLSESAKAKLEKELMDIQNRGMAGQQRMRSEMMRTQQDLQDLEARLLKATSADLRKKIAAYAEANGYDLILDATAAPYSKPTLDVTSGILKAMGVDPAAAIDPVAEKESKKKADESK